MKSESQKGALVELRNTVARDVNDIAELLKIARPSLEKEYPLDSLRAPMQHYPEGQFVVYYEGKLVGYCSTFRISKELAFRKHTWDEITGYGFASLHDPFGDYMYSMDLCVHPDYQDLKIESRLERARKHLCHDQGLKGIVVAGKLTNYWRHCKRYATVKEYLHAVLSHEVIEPELSNKLQAHFHILDVLEDYNSGHDESHKQAIHLVWHNPATMEQQISSTAPVFGLPRMVRLSLIQYKQRKIDSFDRILSILQGK